MVVLKSLARELLYLVVKTYQMKNKTFKAGKYYIGDPCYLFGESWSEVLNSTHYFFGGEPCKLFGKEVIAGSTSYGDGTYWDKQGRSYGVDSGILGCLPVSLINRDKRYTKKQIKDSFIMHIVTFESDFQVGIDDGVFTFGDVVINTRDDEEDED